MNTLEQSVKLSLLHAGHEKLDSNWDYKNVISPFVRLFLITHGEAYANFRNQTFILKPGFMYLIPSFVYNSYACNDYHEQYYVGFFEEIQQGMSIFNLKHFSYEVEAKPYHYSLFKRLVEIHPNKKVKDNTPKAHINSKLLKLRHSDDVSLNYDIETQGILTILLSRFIKNTSVFNEGKTLKGDLNKVLVYITKHLQEPLTVKSLADYCSLSTDHFTRSFYSKFGVTPNKYIQVKRIERAQLLLMTTKRFT